MRFRLVVVLAGCMVQSNLSIKLNGVFFNKEMGFLNIEVEMNGISNIERSL